MELPIDGVLPEIGRALAESNALVLQAPPGAGKTTRVPLYLLEQPWLSGRRIVMLEPRRLAARAAARFMAAQLGESVGATVGHRMRMDTKVGPATRIEVVTEGVLTRMLQDDPELSDYGAILFDEFHERSLQADLGLALARECQQALRPDLRLLVMSATLDGEPVARLLGDAPVVTSRGRSYPVDMHYVPAGSGPVEPDVARTVRQVLASEPGSVLVFLPGTGEIRKVQRLLADGLPDDVLLAPLYGNLPQAEQEAAIMPAPQGRRKVVLATAIAETSLTIEGVRVVVDAGLERRPRFDPVSGLTRLVTIRVSQAAAEQRAGRAGRVEPGVCYRLWAEAEQSRLAAFSPPEIMEADLSGLVLELAQWGTQEPGELAWLDQPPAAAWSQARDLLRDLGALDAQGRINEHGRAMAALGIAPRLAHMVINGARLGWARMACELAAVLTERDILSGDAGRDSDVASRIAALRAGGKGRLTQVRRAASNLLRRLPGSREESENHDSPGILLAFAYPDRIAQRRPGRDPRFRLANGRGAWLPEADSLRESEFLVAASLDGKAQDARIYLAGELSRAALEEHFADAFETAEQVDWDDDAGVVRARRQRRYGSLVLADTPLHDPDPEAVTAALMAGIRRRGLDCLPWTKELRQWQARVQFLRGVEGEEWPDVSDEALLKELETWAAPFCPGATRLSQLKGFPLKSALEARLGYDRLRRLDDQAPTHIEVPSGSRIRLDYGAGETPVLAVKLQELFGLEETPRVGGGRVPVMLHLLSPARRPVQVTQDLAGFWRGAYHEVRKDLRGRYPKHPWPEDPTTAVATRHTKARS